MKNKKKGLMCIDWDGTLLDSDQAIHAGIQQALHAMHRPLLTDQSLIALIGASEELIVRTCLNQDLEERERFWTLFNHFYHRHPLTLKHGVVDFLDRHQHFDLVIVSNKRFSILHEEIKHFKLDPHFRHIYAADGYAPKPEPLMLLAAMRDHHYTREHTWMVGDSHADKHAAQAAGVAFVAVHAPHWASLAQDIHTLHIKGSDAPKLSSE